MAKQVSKDTGAETKQVAPSEIISNDLLNKAVEAEVEVKDRVEKTVSPDAFKKIIEEIARTYSVTEPIALVGMFATLQAGGTNKNKRSNVRITIGKVAFESKTVNKFITQHCKDFTPRQFATFFRNEIQAVSETHGITGNAYVSLRRHYSHLLKEASDEEKSWAADFQLDKPNFP